MQHIITIEHGDNLENWRTIRENVLCCHSRYMQQLSVKSERFREKYDRCKEISNQLGSIASIGLSPNRFEEQKLEVKLLSLMESIERYPMQEYQKGLDKVLSEYMDRQFMDKNYLPLEDRPKSIKSFQALSLKTRLSFLNAEGALGTAETAWMQLQKILNMEKHKAQNNVLRAWAQGRLLVRGASENSVLSLVEWAYLPTLPDASSDHLYDLWSLATRLKFEALTEECMARLFNNASLRIENAFLAGVPLRHLLGLSDEQKTPDLSNPTDDVVATVFHHVLTDENPPAKLSDLVVKAIARGVDEELWAQLSPMINLETARKVIAAMIAYRQVKTEQDIYESGNIKQERQYSVCSAGSQVADALRQDADSKSDTAPRITG